MIISSTDKNFMVKKNYPASISPLLDLFIFFLEMGKIVFKFPILTPQGFLYFNTFNYLFVILSFI